jgi:Cu+-exporting ATPase
VAVTKSIDTDELFQVGNYREELGLGQVGTVEEKVLKVGSAAFVTGEALPVDGLQTRVYVSVDGVTLGYFRLENKYRDGLRETIAALSGYELHLLTGDNEGERSRLAEWFPVAGRLHFDQKPHDKLNYVKQLKQSGKNVLMVGDGLNDAGALNESHVGISIADNIYHFSPASDAILHANHFSSLADFIRFSKSALRVVKMSYIISLMYNLVGISIAVSGHLSPVVAAILMPISSVSVVAFATLNVHIRALLRFGKY